MLKGGGGGGGGGGICVYFVYMIPLETDVLRKHRFQKTSLTYTQASFLWDIGKQ